MSVRPYSSAKPLPPWVWIAWSTQRIAASAAAYFAMFDGSPAGEPANMAKYAAAEAAIKCTDQAIQTHGGNGFALEYGLSDMWWGVRLTRTAPVSREMILNYVAEHSLGLPKSY